MAYSRMLGAIFFGQIRQLNNMLTDVRLAVSNAQKYLRDFYPEIQKVQLEEVEFDSISQQWLITLSFPDTETFPVGLGLLTRKYKLFKIDAQTGEVIAMKIRQIKND